jgi:Mn-containing catalase
MQFTEDPLVKESLGFLMTREIAHFQMFSAALDDIAQNFPPGVLQGDPRYTHVYYNMSDGATVRGPWNEGQGPWQDGGQWEYIQNPIEHVMDTEGLVQQSADSSGRSATEVRKLEKQMAKVRSHEVMQSSSSGETQWSDYATRTRRGGSRE